MPLSRLEHSHYRHTSLKIGSCVWDTAITRLLVCALFVLEGKRIARYCLSLVYAPFCARAPILSLRLILPLVTQRVCVFFFLIPKSGTHRLQETLFTARAIFRETVRFPLERYPTTTTKRTGRNQDGVLEIIVHHKIPWYPSYEDSRSAHGSRVSNSVRDAPPASAEFLTGDFERRCRR